MSARQSNPERSLILVVEDNEINARLVKFILEANGYEVVVTSNGEEASKAVRTVYPQLILMDLQLPGSDGLTITRRFKSEPEIAEIPIIALTAHAMAEHRSQAREAGCCGFIVKPISYEKLLEKVEDAITSKGQSV